MCKSRAVIDALFQSDKEDDPRTATTFTPLPTFAAGPPSKPYERQGSYMMLSYIW
jgi:hypothetical protein